MQNLGGPVKPISPERRDSLEDRDRLEYSARMGKVWGGRFSKQLDREFADFNASLRFDHRLFEFDIETARAHAVSLLRAGVLTEEEAGIIENGLQAILERVTADRSLIERAIQEGQEDIHSFVESQLVKEIGEIGYKLNTGRSRNDQVAADLRLFVREATDETDRLLESLQWTIVRAAERNLDAVMPGFTHLQRGQPVLFSHYLMAYFEMFARDRERLTDSRQRCNISPLGSAALAGSNYPLDRELQARHLGFEDISRNSLDAVSDRDFLVEFLSICTLIMMHLSRLSEDLILFCTSEFCFVELDDEVSTGSSLLPHKKNPDALELIRGKSGRVVGHLVSLLNVLKGLPMTYNKDLQEDKESTFDSVDTIMACLRIMRTVLEGLVIRTQAMRKAATEGFTNATELADYLVRKGLPFRIAHEQAGKIVRYALEKNQPLERLSLEEYRKFSNLFDQDLFTDLTLEANLRKKDLPGGTAPERVRQALTDARKRLGNRKSG